MEDLRVPFAQRVTTTSKSGLDLIKSFEGFSSKPYICPAGVPTIGYGATYYPDGTRVTMKDKPISESSALVLLADILKSYEKSVDSFTRDDISQNNFNALVSFAYNLGVGALKGSTLLKKVNANPTDKSIDVEFMKWNKARVNGKLKVLEGLNRRRIAESKLYFTK